MDDIKQQQQMTSFQSLEYFVHSASSLFNFISFDLFWRYLNWLTLNTLLLNEPLDNADLEFTCNR